MCGLAAIINYRRDISNEVYRIEKMNRKLVQRGPDDSGIVVRKNVLLAHTRLAIMDVEKGKQPMEVVYEGVLYTIIYNGMLYNFKELKEELVSLGHMFLTECDTEVLLHSYIEWREKCVERLNGIFAFVISHEQEIFAARDPFGVKPLYYSMKSDGEWLIASEIKAILAEESIRPILTKHNFASMIALGPSLESGQTLYKNIYALHPGESLKINKFQHKYHQYHHIKVCEHKDDFNETVNKLHYMVTQCIHSQCLSDVPLSAMLSGGLDSSIVCSIASQYRPITTYSLLLKDNEEYFESNQYQPSQDKEYAFLMADHIHSDHKYIEVDQLQMAYALEEAMQARDMCAMADIDSSLLLFAKEIKKGHKVVLSGECADEVFGGYPWFYKEELVNKDTFPWLNHLPQKIALLNPNMRELDHYGIRKSVYEKELDKIMYLESDTVEDKISKKMTHLSIYYFMQTLLMRMDGITASVGIEARVPFADKDIIDYVYNIPWSMKYYEGIEKGILREAFKSELPKEILTRKKSPYPKTYHPKYTEVISELLRQEMKNNPMLLYYFDEIALQDLIDSQGRSFELPWFGQLMKGPQLMAYIYQFSRWIKTYHMIPE
ncbi:MAG: asparagine synthase (glutamine-hydrolyzing) [Erysipelotrichales bacterium]|nr:asparagine synthase (glutamine-hydrolyzing) [Erysipelotrichales bacterium]